MREGKHQPIPEGAKLAKEIITPEQEPGEPKQEGFRTLADGIIRRMKTFIYDTRLDPKEKLGTLITSGPIDDRFGRATQVQTGDIVKDFLVLKQLQTEGVVSEEELAPLAQGLELLMKLATERAEAIEKDESWPHGGYLAIGPSPEKVREMTLKDTPLKKDMSAYLEGQVHTHVKDIDDLDLIKNLNKKS